MADDKGKQPAESYVYQPLDSSKREIRLFYLNPPTASSRALTGTLVHVSLDDKFDCDTDACYDTVSYAWGNPEFCQEVLVNGCTFPVSRNVASALRSMRFSDEPRRIWIDSICIDQTNLEERAQQVMLMGSIYEDGCLNVVHLFSDDEAMLKRAIVNINAVYEEIVADLENLADDGDSVNSNKLPRFKSCVLGEKGYGKYWTKSLTPLKTELDVEALLKFFSNPWFCRMWVVQEAVVAPYNECFCGEHELNLRIIMRVAVWIVYKSNFVPLDLFIHDGVINISRLWYLEEVRNPLHYPNTLLDTLVDYTFNRQATDFRDKLYGLLGVTKYSRKEKKIPDLIRPDYTKPVDQVAKDMTRFMIRESKDLRAFRYIDHGKGPAPLPGVCSWCISLTAERGSGFRPIQAFYKGIIPSLNNLSEEAALACTKHPGSLELTGIQIGLAVDVSSAISRLWDDPKRFLDKTLMDLTTWLSTRSDQTRSNDVRRSLATTLVAGMSFQQTIATEQEIDDLDGVLSRTLDEYGRQLQPKSAISLSAQEDAEQFCRGVQIWSPSRKVFFTDSGRLGLGPGVLQQGDVAFALQGSKWPVMLRRNGEVDGWQLVGVAYINGIMNGEAEEEYKTGLESPTNLTIW